MGEIVASGAQPRTLSDRQKRLVEELLSGKSDQEAWEAAGYGGAAAFASAMRSPILQTALLEHRRSLIAGSMAQKALARIERLITDDKTPAATALAASKWALEQVGFTGKGDEGREVPIHEMTAAQLDAFLAKAQAVVDAGGEPPIIGVVPDNGALSP